ncbi:MAG: hypothetical protein NZ518_03440, partial [Dehalococcoidia bacterium]|nr:hypothetical protein [Dehalococcoidia bacterium]
LRFGGLTGADLAFVGAGRTFQNAPVDSDPSVIHVDTGLGRFDHHQPEVAGPDVCAAKLVWQAIAPDNPVLQRMVDYVTLVDNALVPPHETTHPFGVLNLIQGLNKACPDAPEAVVRTMLPMLDAWYAALEEQLAAEADFANAEYFPTPWGLGAKLRATGPVNQCIAYQAGVVVFVYRTVEGSLRVTAEARSSVDLTAVAAEVRSRDPEATWYLHPSKKLLLNGSRKATNVVPSRLSLDELVAIVANPAPVPT